MTVASKLLPWPIMLFMVGLLIPWIIPIGSLNLSVYRIALLAGFVPCFFAWLAGKAGHKRLADFAILLFCAWCTASLVANHGIGASIEPGGILFLETLGAYLLGRVYIRSAGDFQKLVLLAAAGVLLLLPIALVETFTGRKLFLEIFGLVFPTFDRADAMRAGVFRVQGPFEHPIIFGVNCASVFALAYLVQKHTSRSAFRRTATTAGVGFTSFLSLSSAPIALLVLSSALLSWDAILKRINYRWMILLGFLFCGYLVVEFGSNQTPIQFYISYFTFDQQTGWYRIWIWQYGSASVLAHPLFGIGFADWARPVWMHSDTVDNFWLLTSMRHGIPALILLVVAISSIAMGLTLKRGWGAELKDYRTGYLICLVSYVIAGSTVHFWAAAHAWFFLLLGSGVWMLDVPTRVTRRGDPEDPQLDDGHEAENRVAQNSRPRRHEIEAARQKARASANSTARRR